MSRPATIWRVRRRLRELVSRYRYDVVVCHSVWPQVVFGPAVRRSRIPLGFWLHDAATGRHWLKRWAARTRPDLVLCNSRYTAGTLDALYPGIRSELVHYPITLPAIRRSPDEIGRVRESLETPVDAVVVIQVSRMEAWKGHLDHLEALGQLRGVPGWVSWQVGGAQRPEEQAYVAKLRRRAQELGIASRVRFLGQRADVSDLLAAADIHCQPNAVPEPFGITFIEALNAGLPVVTYAMGGAAEIVDGSCGVLVPPGRTSELAAALEGLIRNPASRERLGSAGPDRARALCDPVRQMQKLEAVLGSVGSL